MTDKTFVITALSELLCAGAVFDTHCWEPSLVFLPSLTNRLFGEAAGKIGGRGGRERKSSEENVT